MSCRGSRWWVCKKLECIWTKFPLTHFYWAMGAAAAHCPPRNIFLRLEPLENTGESMSTHLYSRITKKWILFEWAGVWFQSKPQHWDAMGREEKLAGGAFMPSEWVSALPWKHMHARICRCLHAAVAADVTESKVRSLFQAYAHSGLFPLMLLHQNECGDLFCRRAPRRCVKSRKLFCCVEVCIFLWLMEENDTHVFTFFMLCDKMGCCSSNLFDLTQW